MNTPSDSAFVTGAYKGGFASGNFYGLNQTLYIADGEGGGIGG